MLRYHRIVFAWTFLFLSSIPAGAAVEITAVDPNLVLAADRTGAGGTTVAVLGSGFSSTDTVTVGTEELLDKNVESATRITGRIPYLRPAFYGVTVTPVNGTPDTLRRAVEVTAPVTVTGVSPGSVSRDGGTSVVISGTNFRDATAIKFGTHSLLHKAFVSSTTITGVAPALGSTEPDGAYEVTATDSRGAVTLNDGVTYFTTVELSLVEPGLVSTLGGTAVTFIGKGFKAGAILELGGQSLTGVVFVDPEHMTGNSPALAAGFHDASIEIPGGAPIIRRLADAVEAAPPPEVASVSPHDVSAGTPVTIAGKNFRAVTIIKFGTQEILEPLFVDAGTIKGKAPPLGAGEALGSKDVTAADSRGSDTLRNGVNYVAAPSIVLASVSPTLVSTAGGQVLTFEGEGFAAGDILSLALPGAGNGLDLTSIAFVSSTRMTGRTPALTAGVYDARIRRPATGETATLAGAVEAAPPPSLRSIEPDQVFTTGGETVTIRGARFRPETVFKLGDLALRNPAVSPDGSYVVGLTPAQPAGEKPVTAEDSRGKVDPVPPILVTYVPPEVPVIPGPRVTETALAQGKARFEWENNFDYDAIQVLDEGDNVIATLPGDAVRYEVSTGAKSLTRRFRGFHLQYGPTKPSEAVAKIFQCEVPPPYIGLVTARENGIEFPLRGGHAESEDEPCSDGTGGGGELPKYDCPFNGLGAVQEGGTGYAVSPNAQSDTDPQVFKGIDRYKLTTGFILQSAADKLEIKVFARKIATGFGVELRGRLIHVFPDDGFADEFAFSDTIMKEEMEWQTALYYRQAEDGLPCEDELGNLKQLPAGEYLLDLYVVGGNPKITYFLVADDPLDMELLIEGAPCPPYPLVQVTDLTGFRTVPQVCCVKPGPATAPSDLIPYVQVTFHAQGTWMDSDNTMYRIHPILFLCCADLLGTECEGCADIPSSVTQMNIPDFEYIWHIYEKDETTRDRITFSPSIDIHLEDWGCYYVELVIRDKKCGLESKYATQVAILPDAALCTDAALSCDAPKSTTQMHSTFLFPAPDPGNMYGVVGLDPPEGLAGSGFEGKRPIQFNVLVSPCSNLSGPSFTLDPDQDDPDNLDTSDDDIQFRLAKAIYDDSGDVRIPVGYTDLDVGDLIKVTDPCCEVVAGPKYATVRIDDIGALPDMEALGQYEFLPVFFQAKSRYVYDSSDDPVPAYERCWQNVGRPLLLSNRPAALEHSYWNGNFEPGDASYHFIAKSSKDTTNRFDMGASNEMPINMEGVDAGIPSYGGNNVDSGFISRFMAQGGHWSDEEGASSTGGNTLGNDIQGKPLQVKATVNGGGGAAGDLPSYEWNAQETIFSLNIESTIFKAVIFTGSIGPVPVTVWASVGLGLDFLIEAYLNVEVSPFGPLDGNKFLNLYFDLFTEIEISLPCEIRADILGGIASINMYLTPDVLFRLIPYFHLVLPGGVDIGYCISATFSLYFGMEFCLLFGLGCWGTGDMILIDHAPIFEGNYIPDGNTLCDPTTLRDYMTGGGGGVAPGGLPGGQGGDGIDIDIEMKAIAPVTIVSPDRKTVIDIWVMEEGGSLLQVKVIDTESGEEVPVMAASIPGLGLFLIDPAASFVSNDAAIIAWTAPASPMIDLLPQDDPGYLEAFNENARRAEVHLVALVKHPPNDAIPDWVLFKLDSEGDSVAMIDDDSSSQSEWKVDGKASVAGDLASGEALVAWVRYEDDYMIIDPDEPTKEIHVPCGGDGQPPCPICAGEPPGPVLVCKYVIETVPNYRFQMEKTAIYVRRAGYRIEEIEGEEIYPEVRSASFKISPPGINIEPGISTSPSGAKSYCVWVHDPVHTDLIDSNLGRQILYAVYTKNEANLDDPGQWSGPDGVLEFPDDYPALLEPEIVLSGDDEGLLVFTAIEKGSSEEDSGLGGNRFLFASHLEGGVFGTPFKVHGKCYKREYGYGQSFHHRLPDLIDPMNELKWKNPDWVMIYQSLGMVGSPARSGQVMATSLSEGSTKWSAPVNLTPDGRMHTNVASSITPMGIHSIHLDGGIASMKARMAAARGGLAAEERRFVVKDTPILPDPAIVGLLPDFPYASPGSTVKVVVEVENRGLRGTPVNKADDSSALGVQLSYVDGAGRTTPAAVAAIPEIEPGGKKSVVVDVEMPLDPMRLRAELMPGPFDGNLENNVEEISLGAPAPTDFTCEPIYHTSYDGDGRVLDGLAVQLSWSNPAIYDEILLYRDGRLFASAPGRARRWIDRHTGSGTHTYEIRGRVLVSKSARTSCTLTVVAPTTAGFFRGDSDGSGVLDITDPIFLLNHLFLGGKAPRCPDAADADDSGTLDITDGILVLSFLYLGGKPPADPGPRTCGKDPTSDLLPGCNTACP